MRAPIAALLLIETLSGCDSQGPSPQGPLQGQSIVRFPYEAFPWPADNRETPERVELGRLLFFDPLLSGNRRVACASCHVAALGTADGRAVGAALGDPAGGDLPRASMTIYNVRFQHAYFWDGRAATLEELVSGPIENPRELNSSVPAVLEAVAAVPEYQRRFAAAYGALDERSLRRAVAAFLRTVTANDAPVDRYLAGETEALSPGAAAGLALFFGKARCSRCHYLPLFAGTEGPAFVTTEFRVTGVPARDEAGRAAPRLDEDLGRGEHDPDPDLRHAFKAPTLRNIARTAPYMHNGVFATLEEVVDFYDRGGGPGLGYAVPNLDFVLRPGPLRLSEGEKAQLVQLLREGLTDESRAPHAPAEVPSGLRPGGG
jgi:cytochrome c peroxidase